MAADPVRTRDQAEEPLTRAQHLAILEFGDRADFDNPRLEWRRLFSELLGTFLLVMAAAGGGILVAKGQIALGEQPVGDPLRQADAVAVSRDGRSVYATSNHSVVWFKRHVDGTLTYAGCIAQGTTHGCEPARHKSLEYLKDIAISRDGKSVYAVASGYRALPSRDVRGGNSITRFKRRSNGALSYGGCIADHGAHGCKAPAQDSLNGASGVAVSRDGNSVYVASTTGVTRLKRSPNGAIAYRGCFANQGHHGCEPTTHNSVRKSRAVAVSPDGRSLYDASSSGITTFKRSVSGALTYDGCIENHGTHGCQAPVHDSLRFPNDLALSRDGESVYVASSFADSITDLKRADDGTLTYGGCFADEGVRGCQVPVHDSLSRALGVAVSADGRSVYVAASQPANASTSFSRENSAP